jgi:hypothetical protein
MIDESMHHIDEVTASGVHTSEYDELGQKRAIRRRGKLRSDGKHETIVHTHSPWPVQATFRRDYAVGAGVLGAQRTRNLPALPAPATNKLNDADHNMSMALVENEFDNTTSIIDQTPNQPGHSCWDPDMHTSNVARNGARKVLRPMMARDIATPNRGRTRVGPHLRGPEDILFFPRFPAGTTSLLSRHLTKTVWDKYFDKFDASGVSFKTCIFPGCKSPNSDIGVYAGSTDSYTAFPDLFDPILAEVPSLRLASD